MTSLREQYCMIVRFLYKWYHSTSFARMSPNYGKQRRFFCPPLELLLLFVSKRFTEIKFPVLQGISSQNCNVSTLEFIQETVHI